MHILPESLPLVSVVVYYILQFALGSIFLASIFLVPFWLAAAVQTQYAKASAIKAQSMDEVVKRVRADGQATKARSA